MPLGQPVLSITIDQAEDPAFVESARKILAAYIHLEMTNSVSALSWLHHFHWPLIIRPNTELRETGIWVQWPNAVTPHTHRQLRSLTLLVATLLRTFECVNDGEKVAKLGGLLDMLPQDPDLALVRQIIEDGITRQADKASNTQASTPVESNPEL